MAFLFGGQPASGGWRPAWRPETGSQHLAAGGRCPAAGSRLLHNSASVVLGVVAEGDFGNVYTLTYRQ